VSGDVKVDITGAIKKTKTLKNLPRATKYQLTAWGGRAKVQIFRNVTGGIVGKYKGGTRTGQLGRSIKFVVNTFGNMFRLQIGSFGTKYAHMLEKGGTIRPVRKQYLTIPVPGVKGWARNYPNAFVIKSKKGNLLIVERQGKGNLRPLFILKKSVRIPAFRWLEKSVQQKRSLLNQMLSKQTLLKIAERL